MKAVKRRTVLLVVAIALVLSMTVGLAMAYFSDSTEVEGGLTVTLGGETKIGNNCIIGGSVWLTHSVPAGKMVLARTAVTDTPLTRDIMTGSVLDCSML